MELEKAPFEIQTAIDIQNLQANGMAHEMLLTILLETLIPKSPELRAAYEAQLGEAKANANAMIPGQGDGETLQIIALLAMERVLQNVSARLQQPLVARPPLRSV